MHTNPRRRGAALALAAVFVATAAPAVLSPLSANAATTTVAARSGARCTTVNARSGSFVCTRRAGRLVWVRSATTTTVAGGPTTKAAGAAAVPQGIEGAWKATNASTVGYRVKEVLNGQSTEGAGRTNSVTGTMTIAGTSVTAVELTADLTTLKSDSSRRDGQVQDRILDTASHPTAKLVLKTPVNFGKVPADKEEITAKAVVALTVRGTTKDVTVDLKARRNGAAIEVTGSTKLVFADFGIPDPSFPPFVTTDQDGLLEFAVAFVR